MEEKKENQSYLGRPLNDFILQAEIDFKEYIEKQEKEKLPKLKHKKFIYVSR